MKFSRPANEVLFSLRIAHSVQDVAIALELDPAKFFYVVSNTDTGYYYKQFKIPKKSGGFRQIAAPRKGLALAQQRLALVLSDFHNPKPFVKGYRSGESFLTNARYHEKQKWVLNIDIKDFFPSIGFARVYGLFKSRYFGFNHRVSAILARIVTFQDQLPQGAPTSPILANIIANDLDRRLYAVAVARQLKYTRYADDITISSSKKVVPSQLIESWEPAFGRRDLRLGHSITEAFHAARFRINQDKTRIQFQYERQEVTGLVVNRKANIRRRDIEKLRMKIYSAAKYGPDSAAKIWLGGDKAAKNFWDHVIGWLSYVRQVRGPNDVVLAKLAKQAVAAGLKGTDWIERIAEMVHEFDVFLSHASEDKPKAAKLFDSLKGSGVRVFFDVDSIKWGDSIVEKINHGLLKSHFFLPFLTENFAKKGWTNKELNSALAMTIDRKGRVLPIIEEGFSVGDNYPLLNETLYKTWPSDLTKEASFLAQVTDAIVGKVAEVSGQSPSSVI